MSVSVNGERVASGEVAITPSSVAELLAPDTGPGDVVVLGSLMATPFAESSGLVDASERTAVRAGDVVELAVEGLGNLRNRVVATDRSVTTSP
jgi:2-keto-4-pentenoate hydratase/2-oxohepta-3-ene-1,7-dioic acid hydratase in catechol pathway